MDVCEDVLLVIGCYYVIVIELVVVLMICKFVVGKFVVLLLSSVLVMLVIVGDVLYVIWVSCEYVNVIFSGRLLM